MHSTVGHDACRRAFDDRASSQRSITDIALGYGFETMAHFSRVFRAHWGMAPSEYRAEYKAHARSSFAAPPQGGDASGPAEPDPRRLLEGARS